MTQGHTANNVSSFAANIRKLVYSLWRSLDASDNVLMNAALRSDLLARSPVFRRWRNIVLIFLFIFYIFFTVNVFFSLYNAAWALSLLLNVNGMKLHLIVITKLRSIGRGLTPN